MFRVVLTGNVFGVNGRKVYAPDACNSGRELSPGKPDIEQRNIISMGLLKIPTCVPIETLSRK